MQTNQLLFLILYLYILINFTLSKKLTKFINKTQWQSIRNVLSHPGTTFEMKNKINYLLFNSYKDWAENQATIFKKKHYSLCKEISLNELKLYALSGLTKSIKNYNPSYIFKNYATIYVTGSIYEGATKLQQITIVPSYIRKNKNNKWRLENKEKYYRMLKPTITNDEIEDNEEYTMDYNPHHNKQTVFLYFWDIIEDELNDNSFLLKIVKHKYNEEFIKTKSNREISNLMCCSEESIRKGLLEAISIVQPKLLESIKTIKYLYD